MRTSDIACVVAIAAMLGNPAMAASQDTDWQLDMINNPSLAQLNVEAKGRVYIYDGLREQDVDRAMSDQFHRLERMMFVRTRFAQTADGGESPEDGCD